MGKSKKETGKNDRSADQSNKPVTLFAGPEDNRRRGLPDDMTAGMASASRIGIMGGTFDPIHFGHLSLAEAAREQLKLDLVLFIPAGSPAFKQNNDVTGKEHRYAMTLLSTASNPFFKVLRLELDREGVTYTIDTVNTLRRACRPDAELIFIVGSDAFAQVFKWRNAEYLFKQLTFAVADRPGADRKKLNEACSRAQTQFKAKILTVKTPLMEISSSNIRAVTAKGGSIKYMTPDPVSDYIRDNRLYTRSVKNVDDILREIRGTQSEKRLAHTISVAEEAKRLARRHGVNEEKAYLAGILHDAAKGLADRMLLELAGQYGIDVDETTAKRISLLHAPVGAELAKRKFGITDEDVLNAVRYHTTGRPGMSGLEKIIYVADYIEPTRLRFDGADKVRACADDDLDAAVILTLQEKIAYNREGALHPLSKQALDFAMYHYASDDKEDV